MRERLTVSFIAITLLLLVGAGLIRSYASNGEVRAHESSDLTASANALAAVVSTALAAGGEIDVELLEPFVAPRTELRYSEPGRADVVLTAPDFSSDDPDDVLSTLVVTGEGQLTVSRHHDESLEGVWGSDWKDMLALFGLLALVAGGIGYLVARTLSQPFRQLAVAAAALGRGRFDLDLPHGGVPEAQAIARALESSAEQLRDRLERERAFGLHASHVLRTPLTTLQFRLDELLMDPELTDEARDATRACLKAVAQLSTVAGELVEISGRGVLVAGAAIPLRDLATQVAQRWADALGPDDRTLTAAVEGDIELPFTPGPVEQVLDLLLEDVLTCETGSVRLVFEGAASRLRVDVTCEQTAPHHDVQEQLSTMVDALGGRLERPADVDVLRLHLPRR